MTKVVVSDTGIEVLPPRDTLTTYSAKTLIVEFEFEGEWLQCTEYTAVFSDDINSVEVEIVGGSVAIPQEVLQNAWRFVSISVVGTSAGGVLTSPFVRLGQVLPSATGGGGGQFVTMAQLQEILLNYVLRAELGEYVTQETLDAALAAYIKASEAQEIFDALSDAVDGKADEGALADYWSKSEIGLQTSGDGKEFLANDGKYYPVQGGTGDEKTFIAEYNVTTAQEIIDFIDSSNEPYAPMQVKRAGSYYTVVTAVKQDTDKAIIRTFGTLSGNYYIFTYTITGNVWASASYGFQPTLISGNNIKTINGESLLGSGDIQIQGGGTEVWKECWLEKPKSSPNVFIDTGIAAAFTDELEVTCRCSIGSMSACFNACGSSGTRNGINFLPNSNKAQVFWGGYAKTNIAIDRVNLDVTNDMVITQNSAGVSIAGFNSNGAAVTWDNPYTATGTAAPAQPYRLFIYDRNTEIKYGLFRKAIVRKDANSLIYTIVPEVSNSFTARLKITRKAFNEDETVTYVPVPAGFICHVDDEAAE